MNPTGLIPDFIVMMDGVCTLVGRKLGWRLKKLNREKIILMLVILYPVKFADFIDMHIVRKNDRTFGNEKMGLVNLLIFRKNSPEKNMEK